MDAKKEMIKAFKSMSGKYFIANIFQDWITCCALAVQNRIKLFHDETWHKREKQYMEIISKYDKSEQTLFSEMFALLVEALDEKIEDVLTEVFMEIGAANKYLGQVFTPISLSKLCAEATLGDMLKGDKPFTLYEPTCGAGGMIIAAAGVLHDRGINYQKRMKVVAQDLDWRSVYMCYVQLSLLGISAEVAQGDTLMEPYRGRFADYPKERVFITPAAAGLLI